MKLIRICLSFVILLTGCYSHTTITKDTPPLPPTTEVIFQLKNGTQIVSSEYRRIENGYHIVGKWNSATFVGFVSDDKISEVLITEYDSGKTITGIALGVGIVAVLIYLSLPRFSLSIK
jgi:hypothetical protein